MTRDEVEAIFTQLQTAGREGRVIEFISDDEAGEYAEKGMRARLRDVSLDTEANDPNWVVFRAVFDYEEFEEHNMALESPTFYDSNGIPCRTAHQVGFYEHQEKTFLNPFSLGTLFRFMDQEENERTKMLQAAHKESGTKLSYLSWLELMAASSIAQPNPEKA